MERLNKLATTKGNNPTKSQLKVNWHIAILIWFRYTHFYHSITDFSIITATNVSYLMHFPGLYQSISSLSLLQLHWYFFYSTSDEIRIIAPKTNKASYTRCNKNEASKQTSRLNKQQTTQARAFNSIMENHKSISTRRENE